ncbi:MAG: aminopeptidase, partial [Chitinophagia bacterium]|nr:aminopeptidase [Chitinophagia bacterium]
MFRLLLVSALIFPFCCMGQDNLIVKLDANKSDNAQKKYVFTDVINLENTSIKNQASSGTCWSYSTNSFLESEMMRMGKNPVQLSQLYSARRVYEEKAEAYVRMHGSVSWGDGGECHDVINMYAKYGAMPQSAYTGLHYGTDKNKFGEFQAI